MPAATEPLADVGISSNVKSAGDNAGVFQRLEMFGDGCRRERERAKLARLVQEGQITEAALTACLVPQGIDTGKRRCRTAKLDRMPAENPRIQEDRRMKRIRVLHLIDSLELGGAQTALLAWLSSHDRSKFEVHLASMHGTRKSLFYQRAQLLGIPLILLSPRRFVPVYFFLLPLLLLRGRYDVAHCHLLASNWLGKPCARLLGVPVVISHDQCNDSFRANSALVTTIDRLTNRCADSIFAVSASVKDYLIAFEKVSPAKIRIVPTGLPDLAQNRRTRGFARVVGGAGRFVAQKNFGRFLRIARVLLDIDDSYRFIIAGSGPLEAELKREAARLGVNVQWFGVETTLDRFFGEIDMYLLTSDFEGLPMALLEALQQGVPVAAMAVDGIRDEFSDELLLLNPTGDDRELGRLIHSALENQAELSTRIQRGKEIVSRRFSARRQMREMEQVYLNLLQEKRARPRE
jgi:L-malate glycosyltransferase